MTATRLSDKAVVRLVKDTAEAVGDGDPGLMERTFGHLAVGASAATPATPCAPASPPPPATPGPGSPS